MKRICFSVLACVLVYTLTSHATTTIQGNGTLPQSFIQTVNARAYSRATGTWFLGLLEGGGEFAISRITRPCATQTLRATGIALGSPAAGATITDLALACSELDDTDPLLAGSTLGAQQKVFVQKIDGSGIQESATLKDAFNDVLGGGGVGIDGKDTSGVVRLAANRDFIFAAVQPTPPANGATAFFGLDDSGIAVVHILDDSLALEQTAAVPGDPATKAQRFDRFTTELFFGATPDTPDAFFTPIEPNQIRMVWNKRLDRLYLGTDARSSDALDAGARSVIVARENNGTLVYSAIAPTSAIENTSPINQRQIVMGQQNTAQSIQLRVNQLGILHASTGPSYLIINGGNDTSPQPFNRVAALPLVDDPANVAVHGTLARKDSALSADCKFTVPATDPSHTVYGPVGTVNGEPAATVGACPLPIEPTTKPTDMFVAGDTVYIAVNDSVSNDDDTGVFFSQAIFDAEGKIKRWTPWERAFPFEGIADQADPGRIKFIAVDATTGDLWAVGGDQGKIAGVTRWSRGFSERTLLWQLNKALATGSFSSLDLDHATRGLSDVTPHRYALFGGANKVVFARTSESKAAAPPFDSNGQTGVNKTIPPQEVIVDYDEPENFQCFGLTAEGGCVSNLEYSRRPETNDDLNFFYAGTEKGLYVYAENGTGNGLLASTFGDLNAAPFTTASWQKAPNIPGAIIDIATSGATLYVLAFQTSCETPYLSTLYNIPYTNNLNTMFAPGNIRIIAQSGVGPEFADVLHFSGMEILSGIDLDEQQLVLATNNGLYKSTKLGGVQAAVDQPDALWLPVPTTLGIAYNDIFGMDTPSTTTVISPPCTVWPLSIEDDVKNLNTCSRSAIHQLSSTEIVPNEAILTCAFKPLNFIGSSSDPAFDTLDPVSFFFTDGARRFFIAQQPDDPSDVNHLLVLPYDDDEWQIARPSQHYLFDPALTTARSFYWVNTIGATGIMMAGANNGVLGMEC